MNEVLFVDAFESFEDLDQYSQCLLDGKSFSWKAGLVGEEVSLVTVLKDYENEVGGINSDVLVDNVFVVQLLHDVDFLLDVFL